QQRVRLQEVYAVSHGLGLRFSRYRPEDPKEHQLVTVLWIRRLEKRNRDRLDVSRPFPLGRNNKRRNEESHAGPRFPICGQRCFPGGPRELPVSTSPGENRRSLHGAGRKRSSGVSNQEISLTHPGFSQSS